MVYKSALKFFLVKIVHFQIYFAKCIITLFFAVFFLPKLHLTKK